MQGKLLSFGYMVVVGRSCPSEWPHSYVHMGSANWAQELNNSKKIKRRHEIEIEIGDLEELKEDGSRWI